jgi:hypothetical protein
MMAAETSSEMINSVHSGLAVLTTTRLMSSSISLNIRPWGDCSSRPGRIRSVLRRRSRALPSLKVTLQQTTPAVRGIHVAMLAR